jgi:hypothetical protein
VRRDGGSKVVLFSTAEPQAGEPSVEFMLSLTQVAEVLQPVTPLFVPGSPSAVLGVLVWRDRAVRVFDPRSDPRLCIGCGAGSPAHPDRQGGRGAASSAGWRSGRKSGSEPALATQAVARFVPPELSVIQAVFERPGELAVFLDVDRLSATVAG